MPAPIAQGPVVLPAGTDLQDRGSFLVDLVTKSTIAKASGYVVQNVCDDDAGLSLGASLTINQNTDDCENVTAGTMSVKVFIPTPGNGGSMADVDAMFTAIREQLAIRFGQL